MNKRLPGTILVAVVLSYCSSFAAAASTSSANPVDLAQQHLIEVMDRYHTAAPARRRWW